MIMITETDKISASCRPSTYDISEHNLNMFIQDFGSNVIPIYDSKSNAITCKLDPENKDFAESLYELFPSNGQYYRTTFNKVILETIEYIAQHIVINALLVLELVKYKDATEREFYKLEPIYGKEVKLKRDKVTQIVRDEVTQKLRAIAIPLEKCYVIEFPISLGGREKYSRFIKDFIDLSKLDPVMTFSHNQLKQQTGYNLKEHQRLFDIELWTLTKKYNWHHREISGESFSGFYYIYRRLLFQKNKIILRDHIIQELSRIIATISEKVFGHKVELIIEGLVSTDKVDEILEQWKNGKPITIKDIL